MGWVGAQGFLGTGRNPCQAGIAWRIVVLVCLYIADVVVLKRDSRPSGSRKSRHRAIAKKEAPRPGVEALLLQLGPRNRQAAIALERKAGVANCKADWPAPEEKPGAVAGLLDLAPVTANSPRFTSS